MLCATCGATNPETATRCASCGAVLERQPGIFETMSPPDQAFSGNLSSPDQQYFERQSTVFSTPAARISPEQSLFAPIAHRSEEHTSELQSRFELVCRLL